MPRLFISCVSDEFGNYRDALRKDFTRPNLETKIQEDFIAYAGATLEKLDEYIQHCDAVIHFCGDMTGSNANALSLQYISNKHRDLTTRFPQLQGVLEGKAALSYTQWEAYLALYYSKRLFIVKPTATAGRNDKYVNNETQAVLQQQHLKQLNELGYYAEIHFSNEDELAKKLYQSKLGEIIFGSSEPKPINLPYHSIGNQFKGREDFIKSVHETLNQANGIAVMAIHALGGMGKTRLAVEYAWRYKDDHTALLFVNANAPELFSNNIANLAGPTVLNLSEQAQQDEAIKYAAVISWLNKNTGWLLILDNADTTEAVKTLKTFLSQLQHGHIIITSRIDNWTNPIKHKRLEVLDENSAVSFLMESTKGERETNANDRETACLIANDVGYLALALNQARAYIVINETSFEDYGKVWEVNGKAVLAWYDELQTEYPFSVAVTWQTSFNQLSADATILLNRLCWLAPDPIPRTLLEVEVPDAVNINATEVWAELKQYSLATSTEDRKAFTIHKLVQDVTRNKMNNALQQQTLTEALNWVNKAFVGDPTDVRNWPYLEPLVPHALSVTAYAEINKIKEPTGRLMNQVALIFLNKAQYNIAEPLIRQALEIDKASFGESHPNVARGLHNLALLLQHTNRLQKAEPLMRQALEIDKASFGENHPNVAIDLHNLAQLLMATNRLQEAEPLMRQALEIDKASFGESHPNVARELNNLAQLLKHTNRLQEAEPLMRQALEIDKASFGESHPNVAIDLNNLVQLLQDTNRLQEAESLMRQALEIDKASFGENHPNVAIDLNNLATLLRDTNRLQEAEPLMRKALEIDKASFGENHPNVARDLNNLAQLLQDTNRLQEAEPLMRQALEIDTASFGENHPNVARDLNNLALLLQDTNRLQEAEPLMRQALEIDTASFGENHPNVARDLNNLATLLKVTNRLQEAEPLMRKALEIDAASFGENHPKVARDLNNLAQLLKSTNRLQEGEPLMRKAFVICLTSLGTDHPSTQTVGNNYIYLLQAMGKSEEEIKTILSTLLQ